MWHEKLQSFGRNLRFHSPAKDSDLALISVKLGVELPEALRSALSESNGIEGEYGLGLLWSCERIGEDNLRFRCSNDFPNLYMPFDSLLFFGDAGNGDQFAFPILRDGITRPDVFVWNHEDDSRTWIAPSLPVFFDGWLSGKITI